MAINVGVAKRSANAAEVCGDDAGWWSRGRTDVVAIADGLGHGKEAAVASAKAIKEVATWADFDLLDLFRRTNQALGTTRGAAVGVAAVDWHTGLLTYAAVGNTRAALFGGRDTNLRGYSGIVGAGYRRLNTVSVPFSSGDVLALWTDGLDEQIQLTAADRSVAQLDDIANRLLERFARGGDDCCVIVAHLVPI